MSESEGTYAKCRFCDHFVIDNESIGDNLASYLHLEDDDIEYDHEPMPEPKEYTIAQWRVRRPDLFEMHADGHIGPNSPEHPGHGTKTGQTFASVEQLARELLDRLGDLANMLEVGSPQLEELEAIREGILRPILRNAQETQ